MFFVAEELTHPSRLGVSKGRWSRFQVKKWFIYHRIYLLLGHDMMDLMTKPQTRRLFQIMSTLEKRKDSCPFN